MPSQSARGSYWRNGLPEAEYRIYPAPLQQALRGVLVLAAASFVLAGLVCAVVVALSGVARH